MYSNGKEPGNVGGGGILQHCSNQQSKNHVKVMNMLLLLYQMEAENRLLQQHLELQKKTNKEKDVKLKRSKQELFDVQRRILLAEQTSRDSARSAKAKYKELQEKMYDEGQALRTTVSFPALRISVGC